MTLIRTFAVVVALSLASSALARTDLAGCTYTDLVVKPTQMAAYASRLWYVPDTGEVCEFLDCGGGRAPPKSTVPGCPLYTGTETYAPSYINPKTLGNGAVEAGSSAAAATTPVLATPSETASESAASESASASATASATESASASASATTASATTTDASITILTGANTSTPSKSAESSSAQVTSAASTAGASSSSAAAAASSKTAASGSNGGAATTTSPSSAAGAVQTAGAVLGPCVVAAIAAGLA